MNYYKHATTELQAALQRLVHMPSHMYVHSHSPLSRGSTSRTDVPGGVRVSRAAGEALTRRHDLTETRTTLLNQPLAQQCQLGRSRFARPGARLLMSLQLCCLKVKVHYGYGYLSYPTSYVANTRQLKPLWAQAAAPEQGPQAARYVNAWPRPVGPQAN